MYYTIQRNRDRGVAQFGRALRSGRRGRVFESRRFDLGKARELNVSGFSFLQVYVDRLYSVLFYLFLSS